MYEVNPECALEELKRADHLVYVSLKYTRTCDVILNIIKRLITSYDLVVLELLEYAKSNDIIKEIPVSKQGKNKKAKDLLGNQAVKYFKLYDTLKKIEKADYQKFEEFRKNVTLLTKTKPEIRVKQETLREYFDATKEFVFLVHKYMKK